MSGRRLVLVRHGETQWSSTGRHTGRTDVALTERGRHQADALAAMLQGSTFAAVLVSPLQRAAETLRRSYLAAVPARVLDDLVEWDYGDYEGLTTEEIRGGVPDWSVWTGPTAGGESAADVAIRADRVIECALAADGDGDVAIFAHGHVLRVLAARWLDREPAFGRHLALGTATVSELGYERETRVLLRWNEGCHLRRLEASEPDGPEHQVIGPRLDQVPTLTAGEMREVDRAMVEDLNIDLIQMMENAGRNLADLALTRFGPSHVVVLAGSGGNGGGGLVAARHLANRGAAVLVVLSGSDLAPVPEHQLDILRRMGVQVSDEPAPADLVIDALIGYSLRGDPRGTAADLITWANRQSSPVLALDTPSGLDVTTGAVGDPCVRATATMTLALPKSGLLHAPEIVGELYLADISVPPSVYRRMGFEVPALFSAGTAVRLAGRVR